MSNALAPPLGTNAHSETTDVCESLGCMGDDVAEPDDLILDDRQHLRQIAVNHLLQERAGLLFGKAVYGGQVPFLRRDGVDGVIGRCGI